MAHILTKAQALDEATSAAVLKERLQPGRMKKFVEGVADIRQAYDYAKKISNVRTVSGLSQSGNFFCVCSIPVSVLTALEAVDPNFLKDSKMFYGWLKRHPEYRIASYNFVG